MKKEEPVCFFESYGQRGRFPRPTGTVPDGTTAENFRIGKNTGISG